MSSVFRVVRESDDEINTVVSVPEMDTIVSDAG